MIRQNFAVDVIKNISSCITLNISAPIYYPMIIESMETLEAETGDLELVRLFASIMLNKLREIPKEDEDSVIPHLFCLWACADKESRDSFIVWFRGIHPHLLIP